MGNKEKNFVSAVIYVHNAENRIENFLKTIIDVFEENFEHSEIICVNDSSDDKSLQIIKQISSAVSAVSISVVNMSCFHGLELAMNAGVDMSIGDFVFEFDNTDLDFNPLLIMDVYHQSLKGFDIVNACPDRREKFSSWIFYHIFDIFTDFSYKMSTESFRILSRRVINRVRTMNRTVPYRKVIYANCGLKTDSIKYSVSKKNSKMSDRREKNYRAGVAVDSLILFTEFGYKFSMSMTALMLLLSVFMAAYSLVMYFSIHPIEGWTTTILFLSAAFFGLFGILTIIIKYIQLLLDMTLKRRHYSFESIEKLT